MTASPLTDPLAAKLADMSLQQSASGSPTSVPPLPEPAVLRARDRYTTDASLPPITSTHHATLTPAHDTLTGMSVVLKRGSSQARIAHELTVLRTLRDNRIPNAVALLDSFEDGDTGSGTVLVFRKLENLPNFADVDLVVIARWVRAMAETLNGIHGLKIAHTCISPSTLMLTGPADSESSSLLITSWGDAQFLVPPPPPPSVSSPVATAATSNAAAAPPPPDFTAPDIHALGSLFGRWLEPYVPNCALNYLNSSFVRKSTTTYISRKLTDKLDAQRMNREPNWHPAVANAADLLAKLLEPDDEVLIDAAQVLAHPFCKLQEADFEGTDKVAWRGEMMKVGVRGARGSAAVYREPKIYMRGH
ncbi:hypothetical protein DFJ77DRAFT_460845 [Powellomyces hirtus]|nr:hypothetical protein DFJ77DRAFT_460845 [Powellomyces hirtus]